MSYRNNAPVAPRSAKQIVHAKNTLAAAAKTAFESLQRHKATFERLNAALETERIRAIADGDPRSVDPDLLEQWKNAKEVLDGAQKKYEEAKMASDKAFEDYVNLAVLSGRSKDNPTKPKPKGNKEFEFLFEAPFTPELSLYNSPLSVEAKYGSSWLFELPFSETLTDYSEETGRKKSKERSKDPNQLDQLPTFEPIRKPKQKPPRRPPPLSSEKAKPPLSPEEEAMAKAIQRKSQLVKRFESELQKSNPSGNAVGAQAKIKAGTELIREARKLRDKPLEQDAYKSVGKTLIKQGNSNLHPNRN